MLAAQGGLAAFCLYHYYSAGARLLPRVEDAILRDGNPDFPFFLGWADHDWTLAWQGRGDQVTFRQEYDEHLRDDHVERILEAVEDPRYYRVDGRPLVFVYNPTQVVEHRSVFDRWRQVADRRGHELMLIGNAPVSNIGTPASEGLDAWVQGTSFVFGSMDPRRRAVRSLRSPSEAARYAPAPRRPLVIRRARAGLPGIARTVPPPHGSTGGQLVEQRGRGSHRASTTGVSPHRLRAGPSSAAASQAPVLGAGDGARRLVAVNAWNEWGEGMTMEPSVEHGRDILEASRRALAALG